MTFSRHQAGIGLSEVLVSILIIQFSLLGFVRLQMHTTKSAKLIQWQQFALHLAESHLEKMRLDSTLLISQTPSTHTIESTVFTLNTTVFEQERVSGFRWVYVDVNWQSSEGKQHTVTLKSANHDLSLFK